MTVWLVSQAVLAAGDVAILRNRSTGFLCDGSPWRGQGQPTGQLTAAALTYWLYYSKAQSIVIGPRTFCFERRRRDADQFR
jgi:hypothetical protein